MGLFLGQNLRRVLGYGRREEKEKGFWELQSL